MFSFFFRLPCDHRFRCVGDQKISQTLQKNAIICDMNKELKNILFKDLQF